MSVDEIVRDVVDIFECDDAQAQNDVVAFVDELRERGLLAG
jgi:hypothetical protein